MPLEQGIFLSQLFLLLLECGQRYFYLPFVLLMLEIVAVALLGFCYWGQKRYLRCCATLFCRWFIWQANEEQRHQRRLLRFHQRQKATFTELSQLLTLGKLCRGLLHDIRNPLAVLVLLTEQVKSGKYQAQQKQEMLELADRALKKITDLCQLELNLTDRVEADDVFYLRQELEQIISLCQPKAIKKQLQILLQMKTDYQLFAFRNQLNRVVSNLLLNAIEAYPKKGQKNYIFVKVRRNKFYLLIIIKDNASGIKAQYFKKIFQPHFSFKSGKSNLGLGLYLCQELMSRFYQSKITVSSRLGYGSAFTLRIKNKFVIGESKKG